MAKSIRSKWKRKMRAIKRVRYGKKELDRLKKTLGVQDASTMGAMGASTSAPMEQISEVANVVTVAEIAEKKSKKRLKEVTVSTEIGDIKEVNIEGLKDEKGLYPVWLHPRKIRTIKRKAGLNKKKKTKAKKSKRGTYKKNQKKKQELLAG